MHSDRDRSEPPVDLDAPIPYLPTEVVPSDRLATNAARLRETLIEALSWHEDAEHGRWGHAYAECVLEDYLDTIRVTWMRKVAQLGTEKRESEATIARVEALRDWWARVGATHPHDKLDAALRGAP